ncbi:MAG: hypothetical protein FWC32_12935 [Firmicutes bacterium]|nr:hypothetical protein [Bacillota bacterium]
MAISYLVNIEQLSVLAYFCNIESFPGLPELPIVDGERGETLIKILDEQGMIHKQNDKASVDIVLGFVLANMASPSLLIKTSEDILGYCNRELGIAASQDMRSPNKYRITPLPDAISLARKLWGNRPNLQKTEFIVQTMGDKPEVMQMNKPELEALISRIYTEARQ